MKKVFKTGFFYFIAFAMIFGNSVLSIDFFVPVAQATTENNKVTICHFPPGNGSNGVDISIDESAWPAHDVTHDDFNDAGHSDEYFDYKGQCEPTTYCELELIKTDDGYDPILPGEEITYHLSLTNVGDGDCTDVLLKDLYDPNTSYVSASLTPDEVLEPPHIYRIGWNIGTIGAASSIEIDLVMSVDEGLECPLTLTNVAKFTAHGFEWVEITEYTDVTCDEPYSDYCGDGENNQDWEECDGESNCTEQCQLEEPTQCSDLVLAQVNIDDYDNEGNGDMSSDIYLGSSSWVIPDGTWFPLYWQGASYSLDADIAFYEDVPGLAIQRLDGSLRTVMHTTLTNQDVEEVEGSIEFYNADVLGYNEDSANPLEDGGKHPDEVSTDDESVDFYMWANTGDDGFYTNWEIMEDCVGSITVCKQDTEQNYLSGWEMTLYGSNLVTNGNFENPVVTDHSGQWQLFDSAAVNWNLAWVGSHSGEPVLEYQTSLLGYYSGSQYAELGSNYATKILQNIDTVVGANYELDFTFAPRPNTPLNDNRVQVKFGSIDETIDANSGYVWTYHSFNSLATNANTTLEFIDIGDVDNSYGTFLDDIVLRQVISDTTGENGCVEFTNLPYDIYEVRETLQDGWTQVYPDDPDYFVVELDEENDEELLTFINEEENIYSPYCGDGELNQEWEQCEPGIDDNCTEQCQDDEENECSDLTLARINIDDVQNWGNGDMTSNLFLGDASYIIPSNVWFAVYWNGSYFLDADLASYEDVEGMAVQRLAGSLRTVMHGTTSSIDKEHVSGNIEFYNATVGTQVSDNSNDYPGNNKLENGFDGTGVGQYNAGNDEVWVADGKSFYWLTTTTADDGYYTTWSIIEDCNTLICGVKFNDHNGNGQQGEIDENLVDWTINLFEKFACEEGDQWADAVVEYNPGPVADPNRMDPLKALGVAVNEDEMNFVSLGLGGELILKFDNLIENAVGDDIQVIETTYNERTCEQYPEYVHVYASQNGEDWTDLGDAKCQEGDPTFDLGSLPWAKYVKLVDESLNAGDGFDVNGVRAINCLNVGSEPIESTDTTENGYCFEELDPGQYMVCEEMQEGWINSTPLCQQVVVEEGDSVGVNFGNYLEIGEPYCGDSIITPDLNETCDGDEPIECITEDGYDGWQSCNMPSYDTPPLQSIEVLYCVWNECVTYDYCGDEIVNGSEECDSEEGCTEECLWEEISQTYCGDGIMQSPNDEGTGGPDNDGVEACDDGEVGSASCTSECTVIPTGCITNCGGGGTTFAIRDLEEVISCEAFDISWRTTKSSDTILYFGTESGVYTQNINNDTNTLNHSLQFTDLLPDTTYYYKVRAIATSNGLEVAIGEKSFTTPTEEQCGEVLGEKITAEPLICDFLRPSGSTGGDPDVDGVFQYPNGSLLRDACVPAMPVYLIKEQMKWHVPSWQYLYDYHFGQRIFNVVSTVANSYPDWTGEVLGVKSYADGTLLRGSDMKVYILENGHKRHIISFAELMEYIGQEIIDVSDDVLDQY